tara:strand:- start:4609 stop:4860 length:252 start_codon:yes stop_codon:yes gene_type:complete
MGRFSISLTQQQIRHGYSLLKLMEHLDRELNLLNQQRISAGLSSQEGQRLGRIRFSHLRKIQDCIAELDTSGFNTWLLERQMA